MSDGAPGLVEPRHPHLSSGDLDSGAFQEQCHNHHETTGVSACTSLSRMSVVWSNSPTVFMCAANVELRMLR